MTPDTGTELLRYVGWTEQDASALREVVPHVEPIVADICREVYERTREHPDANAVFRSEAQVRALYRTLQGWLLSLLRGPCNQGHLEQRPRIGVVYACVGLPQRFLIATLNGVRRRLEGICAEAFRDDRARELRARAALGKILDVELALLLETYSDLARERVERAEQQAAGRPGQAMAAPEGLLEALLDASPMVVVALDPDDQLRVWNRTAARATGYAHDEMRQRSSLALLLDQPTRERIRNVRPEAPDSFEAPLRTRSGRELPMRWWISSVASSKATAPLRFLFGLDVTEQRETAQRAREAERLAAIGTLLTGLAHEIRNPLNAASLHVTLLERALATMAGVTPATRQHIRVLHDELQRLSSLLKEFLEFARPRPLCQDAVGLGALLRSVAEQVQPDAQAANASVSCEPVEHDLWVQGEEQPLRQVFVSLARNSLEAGASRVVLRARRVGMQVEVEVEDNGAGVPKGAPIFDPFFTTKPQGTGLGLSVVHRIVNDHGGSIQLQSVPGETIFLVRLPATDRPAPSS